MITRKARQTYAELSTTGLVALLLGAWAGPALASNDISAACPALTAHTDASLHEMLDGDVTVAAIRTVDASKSVALTDTSAELGDGGRRDCGDLLVLPGVSSTDLPRFRRQMFRTDI